MSIFDAVKGMAGNAGLESGLLGHVMEMVNNPETGGLTGLVERFHENGLGGVVSSWIGLGANQGISAEQIEQVLGQDRINAIASKFGVPPEEASAKLAQFLPTVIDKLTPGVSVPVTSGTV